MSARHVRSFPHRHAPGPAELGQNLLVDRAVVAAIVDNVREGRDPLVEWAAGDGAVTRELARLDRPLEAVEIDTRRIAVLRRRVGPHVAITHGDILRHAPPAGPHDVVCNVPFHLTTPVLRRLLRLPHWGTAVLLTQWEVARKRAGVGGATQLTAQWWPWFDFRLVRRVPAAAFSPRPAVDGGLLVVCRRSHPLVAERDPYQHWVRAVFTGPGRGLPAVLAAAGWDRRAAAAWCRAEGLGPRALPRDLTAGQWAAAYRLSRAGQDRAPEDAQRHRRDPPRYRR
ncbi:MAG: 23S ribosomal RNA methyltransferase Erm [Kineosporiaceae bacterium]